MSSLKCFVDESNEKQANDEMFEVVFCIKMMKRNKMCEKNSLSSHTVSPENIIIDIALNESI
jgi:hypothetical protein